MGGFKAFDIRQVNLGKLNSTAKYLSILTYHALGANGVLQDSVQIPFEGRIIGAEKVDGANTRLIYCPDQSVLVGSRDDLLRARRDLIGNPAMSIVDAVPKTPVPEDNMPPAGYWTKTPLPKALPMPKQLARAIGKNPGPLTFTPTAAIPAILSSVIGHCWATIAASSIRPSTALKLGVAGVKATTIRP